MNSTTKTRMTSYERISKIDWDAVIRSEIVVVNHDPREGIFHKCYRTNEKIMVWQEGASRPSWRYIYFCEYGPYVMSSRHYNEVQNRQRVMLLDVPSEYRKAITKKTLEVVKLAVNVEVA